jgi:tetratricopeptide (TPR) repeat protein
MVPLTPIQELENAIRDAPAIPELYLQLAELYLAAGRDYYAERILTKGQAATDDPRVRTLREEVTLRRLEARVAEAQARLAAQNTPEGQAELTAAVAERDRTALEIYQQRVARDPADLAARYALGRSLKQAGRTREAQPHLTAALADRQQRAAAALELGHVWREFGQLDQALRHFRLAARQAAKTSSVVVQREALRHAAELCLQIKLKKLAQRYLAELKAMEPAATGAAE